ncbi:MAG: hypothetical protein RL701_1339 [Pseudomonadota bacterium]|jgi:hypothetical protein
MSKRIGWWLLACVAGLALNAGSARAQVSDSSLSADTLNRFTGPRWSQIRPSRDFEGGCVIGFLSFRFDATGYFVFNNHVRGAWWVDELGNLKLRTRDGLRFTLIVEGNTLRPNKNLPFMKRTFMFQRCPA